MAIVVNTNVDSLKVQRNLNKATSSAATAMERMTTGLKINTAADDAAGLVISKGIQTQQRGSVVATNNAQNGINLLQTAEGNLSVIQDNLMRIRDLTLQAMNGGYSVTEVQALEEEATARVNEINRIAGGAKFNEFELFKAEPGSADGIVTLQIGAGSAKATNTIDIDGVFQKATVSALTGRAAAVKFTNGAAIETRANFETLLNDIDKGIKEVSSRRGTIGSTTNRLNSAVDSLAIQNENLSAANSRITDADIAKESSEYTRNTILQQASASLLVQANQAPNIALTLI